MWKGKFFFQLIKKKKCWKILFHCLMVSSISRWGILWGTLIHAVEVILYGRIYLWCLEGKSRYSTCHFINEKGFTQLNALIQTFFFILWINTVFIYQLLTKKEEVQWTYAPSHQTIKQRQSFSDCLTIGSADKDFLRSCFREVWGTMS